MENWKEELSELVSLILGLKGKLTEANYENFFDELTKNSSLDTELIEAIDRSCDPSLSSGEIEGFLVRAVNQAHDKHGTEQKAALDAAISLLERSKRKILEGNTMSKLTRMGFLIEEAAGGITLKYRLFDNGQGDIKAQAKDLVERLMKDYFPSRINGAVVMGDGSTIGVIPALVGTAAVDVDVFDLAKRLGYQIKSAGSCGALVSPIGVDAEQGKVLDGNEPVEAPKSSAESATESCNSSSLLKLMDKKYLEEIKPGTYSNDEFASVATAVTKHTSITDLSKHKVFSITTEDNVPAEKVSEYITALREKMKEPGKKYNDGAVTFEVFDLSDCVLVLSSLGVTLVIK